MPQSGTHMLINVLSKALEGKRRYAFKFLGHAKAGRVNVTPINKMHLYAVFFYYRNQIDRVMSARTRGQMGDQKNNPYPSEPGAKVDDYSDFIINEVKGLLSSEQSLNEMHVRYQFAQDNKKLVRDTCANRNVTYFVAPYELMYDNFEYIYSCLGRCGVKIEDRVKKKVNSECSSESAYQICRTPRENRRYYHSNHVSHSKGEPYYWAKMFDFEEFYNSLPEKNKELIKGLVKEHPHKNLPKELFE